MFCKNCGKESNNNQKFCINCGIEFVDNKNTNTQTSYSSSFSAPKEPWTRKKIINTIITIVLAGGFIVYKIIVSIDNAAVDKNNLALDSYNSGNTEQAIMGLKQASESAVTNDNKINSLKNLAFAYLAEGENDLAINSFKEALSLTKTESFDHYLISGEIALLEGKPNSALLAYNKAYDKNTDDFQVNNALNLFYLDLYGERPQYENYPKALIHALKANEVEPSEVTKENLALAYYFNENYKETISILASLNLVNNPYLTYYLGLAYLGDEQLINAKHYLKIAVDAGVEVPQEIINYINSN